MDAQRIYLSPAVGLSWNYFLYHPDLLYFSMLAEPGYYHQDYEMANRGLQTDAVLLNGNFSGTWLRQKPYATTMSYGRSHDDYHYDFFNSATVDTETYGLGTGYREGPVPFSLDFQKTKTDSQSFAQEMLTDQTTLNLHAHNERAKEDATDLTYQFGEFDYDTHFKSTSSSSANTYNRASITDAEHFDRSTLNSAIFFRQSQMLRSDNYDLNGSTTYTVEHTPNLSSFYSYALSDFSGTGAEAIQNAVSTGIQHRLYESLTSGANIHASTLTSSFGNSHDDSQTVGMGGSVDYTKRLGSWGRFSMGNGANYDITQQQVTGSEIFISDEAYSVPSSGPMIIRLKSPREISITSVQKNNVELAPSEYTVIQTSDPWQIQFFSGGPNNVLPGDAVTVSYTVKANPSGNYSIFSDSFHISLRFWQNRAEIYGRYTFTENQANSPDILLQNVNELEAGGDVDWRGFHVHGGYTDHRSTLYDYQTLAFTEDYSHPIFDDSTIGVNLSQQWTTYPPGSGTSTNQTQTATFYSAMLHYEWRPFSTFNWRTEAGVQHQSGLGYDEDLFAARSYFNWTVGKLELHLGYEHEDHQYTVEKRTRDFVFLRMRRNF